MSQMDQISLAALNAAAAGHPPVGALTYVWLRNPLGLPAFTLLVGVADDFTQQASFLNYQFCIRSFHQGDIYLVQLMLQLNQAAYALWLDYWHPDQEGARCLQGLAQQAGLTAALCTSRRVIGAITIVHHYQALLADLIARIQPGPAWTVADFARARDAIGQNQSHHWEQSEPACST